MASPHRMSPVPAVRRFPTQRLEILERDLHLAARRKPMALVIPGSWREFRQAPVRQAIESLRGANYLSRVVVAVSAPTAEQAAEVWDLFTGYEARVTVLWVDDPRLLARMELQAGRDRRARRQWVPLAFLVAEGGVEAIAVDSCQDGAEARQAVASLLHPAVVPEAGLSFVKGVHGSAADGEDRQIARLFLRPLLRSLRHMLPHCGCAEFLGGLHSPLRGGYAVRTRLIKEMRLVPGEGMLAGMLAEANRLAGLVRLGEVAAPDGPAPVRPALVAEVEAQPLEERLVEIALAIFGAVAAEGTVLTADQMRTLEVHYRRTAEDSLADFAAEAEAEGLPYNQHHAECALSRFGTAIRMACRRFKENPAEAVAMPTFGFGAAAAAVGSLETLCSVPRPEPASILANWSQWAPFADSVRG